METKTKKFQFCETCGRKKNLTRQSQCWRCREKERCREYHKKYNKTENFRRVLAKYRSSEKYKRVYQAQLARGLNPRARMRKLEKQLEFHARKVSELLNKKALLEQEIKNG